MSFLLNFNPSNNIKTDFITKYGSYAEQYDALDYLGNQKNNTKWPLLLAVLFFILMLFSFIGGSQQRDPETNELKPKTLGKKILTGLGWFFLVCMILNIGYGVYLYFAVYMVQYAKWFNSLPSEAKVSIGITSTLDNLKSDNRNARKNKNRISISY